MWQRRLRKARLPRALSSKKPSYDKPQTGFRPE